MRAVLLMVGTVVLVFGALTWSPRRCRRLGWLALLILGVAMLAGALLWPAVFTPTIDFNHFAFAAASLPMTGHLAGRLSGMRQALREQRAELQLALEHAHVLATRDDLTGLPNRRSMQDHIVREIPRIRRRDSPQCIAVLDLDHFKAVNDRHGHAIGDKLLQTLATRRTGRAAVKRRSRSRPASRCTTRPRTSSRRSNAPTARSAKPSAAGATAVSRRRRRRSARARCR